MASEKNRTCSKFTFWTVSKKKSHITFKFETQGIKLNKIHLLVSRFISKWLEGNHTL